MRCLVVADRFFGDVPGGAQRIAWELARLMREAGHDVTMFCGATDADQGDGSDEVEGVRVVRYRIPTRAPFSPLRWTGLVAAARERYLESLGAETWDLVHGHGVASTLGVLQAAPRTLPLAYTVHSPIVLEQALNWSDGTAAGWLKRRLGLGTLRRAEASLLGRARVVHALSRFTVRALADCHGDWVPGKAQVIPWWAPAVAPGVDRAQARRSLGVPEGRVVVFTLRRLVRRMGLDVLLEALALLGEQRPWLLLGGDGPERGRLEAQAARLGLGTTCGSSGG